MSNKRRAIFWGLSGAWIVLIYSTLSLVRGVSTYLKGVMPLSVVIVAMIVLILMGVIISLVQHVNLNGFRLLFLMLLLIGYAYGIMTIKYPDEKIHFIQYGVLAVLLLNAFKVDFGRIVSYIGAFCLCALAGYGDELLQGLIPNRYYDINDVILNAVSGAMGLGLAALFENPPKCQNSA